MKKITSLSELNTIVENLNESNILKKPFYEIKVKRNSVILDKDIKTALHEFYLKEKGAFIGNERATLLEINEKIVLNDLCEYKLISGSLAPAIDRLELKHFYVYLIYFYKGCDCSYLGCESLRYICTSMKVRCKKSKKLVLTKENKTKVNLKKIGKLTKQEVFEIFKENYL